MESGALGEAVAQASERAAAAERAFEAVMNSVVCSPRAEKKMIAGDLLSAFTLYSEASSRLRVLVDALRSRRR